jgi:positive phototaxis protein PixI
MQISPHSFPAGFPAGPPAGLPQGGLTESFPQTMVQEPVQERLLRGDGLPHIRLRVDEQIVVAVSTLQSQEVITIPQQRLTVIPNMPPMAMGLINHRSRVFWLLDLPHLLGLTPLAPRAAEYTLAIVRVGQLSLGLAVREVQGNIRLSPDQIQSPLGQVNAQLVPYLKGVVIDPTAQVPPAKAGQKASEIWVLDAGAIAQITLS